MILYTSVALSVRVNASVLGFHLDRIAIVVLPTLELAIPEPGGKCTDSVMRDPFYVTETVF